jgi:hypothetical protein
MHQPRDARLDVCRRSSPTAPIFYMLNYTAESREVFPTASMVIWTPKDAFLVYSAAIVRVQSCQRSESPRAESAVIPTVDVSRQFSRVSPRFVVTAGVSDETSWVGDDIVAIVTNDKLPDRRAS